MALKSREENRKAKTKEYLKFYMIISTFKAQKVTSKTKNNI